MRWDDLRIVLAIARSGTLTEASKQLQTTQPTISRRLQAIEASLGTKLFIRHARTFTLTEKGQIVFRHAEKVEKEVGLIDEKLNDLSGPEFGSIRIATMPWIITHLLIPHTPCFFEHYPGQKVEFIASASELSPVRAETEIALRFELPERPREIRSPVGQISYSVYGRSDARGKDHWIGFGGEILDKAPGRWLREHIKANTSVDCWANDAGLVFNLVVAGMGNSLLPDCLAAHHPELTRLSSGPPEITRKLYCLTHRDSMDEQAIPNTLSWIKDALATADCSSPAAGA